MSAPSVICHGDVGKGGSAGIGGWRRGRPEGVWTHSSGMMGIQVRDVDNDSELSSSFKQHHTKKANSVGIKR